MDPVTRRQALAGAAATGVALASARSAFAQQLTDNIPIAVGPALEPEVITVTDTGFAAWWRTEQAGDTTVVLTAVDGPLAGQRVERRLEEGQTVHAARVDDLTPGTTYRYELRTNGLQVNLGTNAEADPGEFRTLVRPPGALLARIALLNDIHVGETISGQITAQPIIGSIPPSYTTDDYAFKMLDAGIGELRGRPLDLVIANGDLTDRGREDEIRRALAKLRELPVPLLVTRGNHDRRLEGACADDGDCLRVQGFPDRAAGDATLRSVARVGDRVAVVGLDSCEPDSGDARLDLGEQPAWLDETLTTLGREGRVVIVAFHHPLRPADQTDPPSFSDHVDGGRDAILAVLAKHEHVRLCLHGHTHRNNLGFDPGIGQRLPFLENGAMKEYPAGYGLLDVHEGGILRTFHRPVTDFTRTWVKTSAMQIGGFQPALTRGNLASRAFSQPFGGLVVGAGPLAAPATPGLRVRTLRRRSITRFLERGLAVDVTVPGRRTEVLVQAVAATGDAGSSRPVLVAAGRRRGSGRVRLRARGAARRRLQRRRSDLRVVLTVSAAGVAVRRRLTLTRRRAS